MSLLHNKVMSKWNELKDHSVDVKHFMSSLESIPNIKIGVFGGAVRDWELGKIPKDIDLVLEMPDETLFKILLDNFGVQKNSFHGNVISIENIMFDVWSIQDTYAFRTGQMSTGWQNLPKTVPFTTDAIVVRLDGFSSDYGFYNSIKDKKISFVNRNIQDPYRIACRARAQASKYQFELSSELQDYVDKHDPNFDELLSESEDEKPKKKLSSSNKHFKKPSNAIKLECYTNNYGGSNW